MSDAEQIRSGKRQFRICGGPHGGSLFWIPVDAQEFIIGPDDRGETYRYTPNERGEWCIDVNYGSAVLRGIGR